MQFHSTVAWLYLWLSHYVVLIHSFLKQELLESSIRAVTTFRLLVANLRFSTRLNGHFAWVDPLNFQFHETTCIVTSSFTHCCLTADVITNGPDFCAIDWVSRSYPEKLMEKASKSECSNGTKKFVKNWP